MDRKASGWLFLVAGLLTAFALYEYDGKYSRRPGARGSLAKNLHLATGVNSAPGSGPLTAPGAATATSVAATSTGQQAGAIAFDPDSDEGSSPSPRAQTEAAYNQGSNEMGNPTGPGENQNDEDGLDRLFSF